MTEKEDAKKEEESKDEKEEVDIGFDFPTIDTCEELAAYEESREQREKELRAVLTYLLEECMLTMHKGIKYDKAIEYFRGVDFHLMVLKHKEKVLAMLPSFVKDGFLTQLEHLDDSIKLGQFFIYSKILFKGIKHPNYIVQPGTREEKYPEYLGDDIPVFAFDGFYDIAVTEDKGRQKQYLVVTMGFVLSLVLFRLWPEWLQEAFWYSFVYTFVAYIVTIYVRIALWIAAYHAGVDFWLFPNYFVSFTNPYKILFPVAQYERRPDQKHTGSLIFRLTSASLIIYIIVLFFSDEKNVADLKDLGGGLNDMLDYGHDFFVGH
mmetsp:Transcript_11827/g.19998  ORF Transcript_11827/g.19998 Transcript_11827/m.19998 type:complete len:320 (+) Transcript_11827:3-962(+)